MILSQMKSSQLQSNMMVVIIAITVLSVFTTLAVTSNAKFIIDIYSLNEGFESFAYIVALSIALAIMVLSYLLHKKFKLTFAFALFLLIAFQILGVIYARSTSDNNSTIIAQQGSPLNLELEELYKQRNVQMELQSKCPATHIKNCITPAHEKIISLNQQVRDVITALNQHTPSLIESWNGGVASILNVEPKTFKISMDFLFAAVTELVIFIFSIIVLSAFDKKADPKAESINHELEKKIQKLCKENDMNEEDMRNYCNNNGIIKIKGMFGVSQVTAYAIRNYFQKKI